MDSPMLLLREAQAAIAAGDHPRAVEIFTNIRRDYSNIHISLPLLSRAICYNDMKEYAKAIADCEEVLAVPDTRIPEEIVRGCSTSHAAASGLAAEANKKLGRDGMSKMHMRMMQQKQIEAAKNISDALQAKGKGNELYKKGKYEEALTVYETSLKLDPTSEAVWSNLSMVYVKLEKYDRAQAAARQCTIIKPTYPKGWYRLGMALLAEGKAPEAMAAFQAGLKYAPEDPDLKAKFLEAATHAEKDGFEPTLMGLMIDLARESFDVRGWWTSYSSVADFVDPKEAWTASYVPALESESVKTAVETALKAALPDVDIGDRRPTAVISADDFAFGPNDLESYIHHALLAHPLSVVTYLLPLLQEAEPKGDWHAVISFNYKPPKGAEESSQMYTALVDKKKMRVLDWEGLALDYRNSMGKGKMATDKEMNGNMFRALVDNADTDKIIYSTGDVKMLTNFCTEFWAAERRAPGASGASSKGLAMTADASGAAGSRASLVKMAEAPKPTIFDHLDSLLKPDNLLVIFGGVAVLLAVYIAFSSATTSAPAAATPE